MQKNFLFFILFFLFQEFEINRMNIDNFINTLLNIYSMGDWAYLIGWSGIEPLKIQILLTIQHSILNTLRLEFRTFSTVDDSDSGQSTHTVATRLDLLYKMSVIITVNSFIHNIMNSFSGDVKYIHLNLRSLLYYY